MCANCASRFQGFAEEIADEVSKVVIKKPIEISGMPAQGPKTDEMPMFGRKSK
jgi:hypothetical protein